MAESATSMSSFTTNEDNVGVNDLVYKSFNDLNDTMDLVEGALMKNNDGKEIVKEVREFIAETEIIDLVDDDQEAPKKRRKVTFSKEYSKCNEIIDEVLRVLQNITGIDIAFTPRPQLEKIIKILLASVIDQFGQLQDAQTSMGAMAELIEELIDRGVENEKIRKNEIELKTQKARLEKEIEHLVSHSENLNSFIMLGSKQKDELNKLIDYQVENVKLKNELKKVEEMFKEKVAIYKETYDYSQKRKERIIELNKAVENELEKREKLTEDFNDKLKDEKDKSKDEKEKRVKATKENKKLSTENKILQDKLKEAKAEWIELNNKKEELEANWEKEKAKYDSKIKEQKKDMNNINQLNATSSQLLKK